MALPALRGNHGMHNGTTRAEILRPKYIRHISQAGQSSNTTSKQLTELKKVEAAIKNTVEPTIEFMELEMIELALLNVVKPILILARLVGYFPLKISTRNGIRYSKCSLPVAFSLFTISLHSFAVALRIVKSQLFTGFASKNSTERFAEITVVCCVAFAAITIRVTNLRNGSEIKGFWKENVKNLGNLAMLDKHLNFLEQPYSENLRGIRRSMMTSMAVGLSYMGILAVTTSLTILAPLFFPSAANFMPFHQVLHQVDLSSAILVLISVATIILTTNLHFSYPLLLSFYPRIYALSFRMIAKEMKSMRASERDFLVVGRIENLVAAFHTIEHLVNEYTRTFSLTIVVQMLVCCLAELLYMFCSMARIFNSLGFMAVVLGIPAISYGAQMFLLVSSTSEVTVAAKEVRDEVCRVDMRMLPGYLHTQLHMFVTRVTGDPPSVAPGRYFTLNHGILTSVASSIVTYIIILVQFRNS